MDLEVSDIDIDVSIGDLLGHASVGVVLRATGFVMEDSISAAEFDITFRATFLRGGAFNKSFFHGFLRVLLKLQGILEVLVEFLAHLLELSFILSVNLVFQINNFVDSLWMLFDVVLELLFGLLFNSLFSFFNGLFFI